ncbi:MAG: LacI family DNA-binding transcriptional regulator [Spirochaetaceae bacterium]|nr:LacI family DNA-binding transcriptional regulator [Spirochaetaceae bacterium]
MTVREIAAAAHVSIGTVDRVLHGRGRVAPETRAKIEAIIAETGYKPNPIARRLKLNKAYCFAVLLPSSTEDSGYWKIVCSGILKAAKELIPFGITLKKIEYNRYDPDSLKEKSRLILESPFDGLLMAPVLPEASSQFLKLLPKNFPVVFLDAELPGYQPLSRIGQNAFQGGVLAGRLLEAFSVQKGPYYVISAHAGDFHIRKRVDGFLHYFQTSTLSRNIKVFECFDIEHKETREAFLQKTLKESGIPGGVFVTNASVYGVADFLNRKTQGHISVVGYDLVPENERLLREGLIDCILSQRPEYQGYEGLYRLYDSVVLERPTEKETMVPIDIYLRENLPATPASQP